ncbi:MAG TPA: hypothetical protein VM260_23715 [Pirellula sp.]|nr:hypothetical protein [Pirellula sp.]
MPAPVNFLHKPTKHSVARMLAQMTIGLGITAGAALVAGPVYSQSCDRCAGLKQPNCGCETENHSRSTTKQCGCKCLPKPSLGEQLLSHFDRVGDQIEAKARTFSKCQCDQVANTRHNPGPTCGCESSQGPSCGCETCSAQSLWGTVPSHNSPVQVATPSPLHVDPNRSVNGAIGDKQLNTTPSLNNNNSALKPQLTQPPEPPLDRIPFGQWKLTPDNKTQSDPPPAWAPKAKVPQKSSPESKLPDVLVDPFKDDASLRGTRQRMEGILLTSDRRAQYSGLKLAPPDQGKDAQAIPIQIERPTRLTPKQRNETSVQLEAADSAPTESSQVVSSGYEEMAPVKATVRKETSNDELTGMPHVPRIRVPARR